MPIIDFTNPIYVIAALALLLLCSFLGNQSKKNTLPCIVLLVFLTILIGHTIELSVLDGAADIFAFAVSIAVDEIFIFVSFLMFMWLDRIQIEAQKNTKKGKNAKSAEKIIENDGLDVLWKKL